MPDATSDPAKLAPLSYRDDLEAAEARVKSLEIELEEARERRDELAGQRDRRSDDKRAPKAAPGPGPSPLKGWLTRVSMLVTLVAGVFCIITVNRYCNAAPVRKLDDQPGTIVYSELVDPRRAVMVTQQSTYDEARLLGDQRIITIDLETGEVSRSGRLIGGHGAEGKVEFHGRHGELLWFENQKLGLHARRLDGSIAIDRDQVAARMPNIKRVGLVVADSGLHIGGDDGYWYRVGDSAEAVRVPQRPDNARILHRRASCDRRASIAQQPDSPNKQMVIDQTPLANTGYLEINWLGPISGCPIGSPPGLLFVSRSRINGPLTLRMVGLDGVERFASEELGDAATTLALYVVGDRLVGLPARGGAVGAFSMSLADGALRWRLTEGQIF